MKHNKLFDFLRNKTDWKVITTLTHKVEYDIIRKGNILYLYFQASNGKRDWKDNLNFFPTFGNGYKNCLNHIIVHSGFKKEYHSCNDIIMNEIRDNITNHQTDSIVISGWSSAAALSTLAAEDLFFRTGFKPDVIIFGSPKVCFDEQTANYIKSCCKSFVSYCDNNDITTKLPFIGSHINKVNVGEDFSWSKIFHPFIYHYSYGKIKLTN